MFKKLVQDTRVQIAIVLAIILAAAVIKTGNYGALIPSALCVAIAMLVDLLFIYITKKKIWLPSSGIVSGLLIAMIMAPSEPIALFVLMPALAMAAKHALELLRLTPIHIFNPAALGVIGAEIIFKTHAAWWAPEASLLTTAIILALGAGYVLKRLGRLHIPYEFLVLYAVLIFVKFGRASVLAAVISGTTLLFAFIMLPEPQTSPNFGIFKYGFPALVALVLGLFVLSGINIVTDILLTSLVLADLAAFIYRAIIGKIPQYNRPA